MNKPRIRLPDTVKVGDVIECFNVETVKRTL